MSMTDGTDEVGILADHEGPRRIGPGDEQEVVAVCVGLADTQRRHHGTRKALKTYVKPAATPKDGSCDVRPNSSAASARSVPTVYRPPNRTMLWESVPGGGAVSRMLIRPFTSPTTSPAGDTARANENP